ARPGRPATIRVYPPQARASEVRVRVTLAAPPDAPARYELRSAAGRRRGVIAAGAVTTEGVTLCVAPGAPADLALAASSTARIPGMPLSFDASPPRRVGARVGPIETADTGSGCRPGRWDGPAGKTAPPRADDAASVRHEAGRQRRRTRRWRRTRYRPDGADSGSHRPPG